MTAGTLARQWDNIMQKQVVLGRPRRLNGLFVHIRIHGSGEDIKLLHLPEKTARKFPVLADIYEKDLITNWGIRKKPLKSFFQVGITTKKGDW